MAGGGGDAVTRGLLRAQQAGVELDAMAMQALATLPEEHASEMLEYVADNHAYLRNASKYITSTVARGFVPRRSGMAGDPAAAAAAAGHFAAAGGGGAAGSCGPEYAEGLRRRASEAGIGLSDDAAAALAQLAVEHAEELLAFVLSKHGELRDPSNYIASTVARGFKSRREGPVPGGHFAGPSARGAATATHDVERAKQRMQEAGVELDQMAWAAIESLPAEHALEIMDYVAENHRFLRNPSSYVSSTVSRGFVSRKGGIGAPSSSLLGGKGPPAFYPAATAHAAPLSTNPALIPPDVTPLERRVLQVNAQVLSPSQQVDFQTYLALRCVPQWQAEELLQTVQAKCSVIASPCNYIQAAVTKIQRGQGWSSGGPVMHGAEGYGQMPAYQENGHKRHRAF